MKRVILLMMIFGFFVASPVLAARISGTGYGKTLEDAQKEALGDLSQNIRVEVKSEFSSIQTQRNQTLDELKTKTIHLKSELPILGAQLLPMKSSEGFMVDATLDDSARPLYEKELTKEADLIAKNLASSKKNISNEARVTLLQAVLSHIEQYYSLRIVAQFLKSQAIPGIPVTAEDIAGQIAGLEKKADTLDFGIGVLSRNFSGSAIFIYPPTAEQSSEVTQFGRAVKDRLSTALKSTDSPAKADGFITGSYRILDNGLELICHLSDKDHKILKTAMVFFLPSAYAGYTVKPLSLDFEKLIQEGFVISGDFRVDIKTKKGRSDLLYTNKDTMAIMVKMNKPGYFYLVSHNIKENGTYSYIINFTDDLGDRKFVYYVSGDEVNKWVVLGEFSVVPPFGVETLQMVASTSDLIERVPAHYLDQSTGLFTIGTKESLERGIPVASKPEQALVSTRGLMMKKKAATAEAMLMFTSMHAD